MSSQWLPSISRLVAELDGSMHIGASLYTITGSVDFVKTGHHSDLFGSEKLTFTSPLSTQSGAALRATFDVIFEHRRNKRGLPSRTEYEVEIRDEGLLSSILIKSQTDATKKGAVISIYRRDGACIYPLWGAPKPWELRGETTERIDRWRTARLEPPLEPYPAMPAMQGARDGMVYLTHLALASSVRWRESVILNLPSLLDLPDRVERMFKTTFVKPD